MKKQQKSRGVSKANCQTKHTKKRALERFGVSLDDDDIEHIIGLIQAGEAKFIEKQSHRLTVFNVMHQNISLNVVYDKTRKTIATVLTDGMVDEW